jgi:hypothetical protein
MLQRSRSSSSLAQRRIQPELKDGLGPRRVEDGGSTRQCTGGRRLDRRAGCLVILTILALPACRDRHVIRDGDEVFATLEEAVTQVSWTSASDSVVARRDPRTGRLSYRFEREGKEQRCGVDSRRDAAVRQAFQVRAGHVFDRERTERLLALPREEWVELEVRGVGQEIAPFRLALLPTVEKDSNQVDALMRDFETGFSVDAKIVDILRLSCERVTSR